MESSDGSSSGKVKGDLTRLAIEQHLTDNKNKGGSSNEDEKLLLTRLVSQLEAELESEAEAVKKEFTCKLSEPVLEVKEPSSAVTQVETNEANDGSGNQEREMGIEEIVKELKQVKRQNTITHWLLGIMIALTAAWQFSEVTLIMKMKNRVTHPFKSFGKLITGAQDAIKHLDGTELDPSRKQHHAESPSPPAFHMPDLPLLGANGEEKHTPTNPN